MPPVHSSKGLHMIKKLFQSIRRFTLQTLHMTSKVGKNYKYQIAALYLLLYKMQSEEVRHISWSRLSNILTPLFEFFCESVCS